ncbi:hypothetical protein DSO57_1014623 [Entomophthora muscae]|uniref:Uncharacterized protein n=1 Tax=Entomophthora muscae TaxID=34485 RepID=A0ACC2RK39_9FUNG|nr:hypothetical protein DSO57_1014623 [Entomophthora muscae]
MLLPVIKFVVFSLAPFLLLLWSTSPDLWFCLSSSGRLVGDNPSSLLHLPTSFLISGEALVKSLTCDNLDLSSADPALLAPVVDVRIDNSPPLEPQAQERESNLEPGLPRPPGLWTAGPPTHIFLGSSPCKLTLKMMTRPVKQIELRKLLH